MSNEKDLLRRLSAYPSIFLMLKFQKQKNPGLLCKVANKNPN